MASYAIGLDNATLSPDLSQTTTNATEIIIKTSHSYVEFKFYVEKYAISSIAFFGILGNLLNIAILTRRQFHKNVSKLERSSLLSLIILAVSDLFVCLCFFPKAFKPNRYKRSTGITLHPGKQFWFYWDMYGEAATNTFIVWSTWLTVSMAISRYVALCHPMKARRIVGLKSTKVSILLTFLLSVLLNIPFFLIYESVSFYDYHYIVMNDFGNSFTYTVIGWLQALFGTFLPIGVLILCNVSLARTLQKSDALRRQCTRQAAPDDDKRHRITLTLVIIIVLYLTCVAPSRLIVFVIDVAHSSKDIPLSSLVNLSSALQYVVTVLNLTVAVNFAVNFLLYCVVNVYFREVVRSMLARIFPCFRVKMSARFREEAGYSSSKRILTMETCT